MPINSAETYKTWVRYSYCRDNGHTKFVAKADQCEKNFAGDQWLAEDKAKLEANKRPALTINKIISTISNVLGEQIHNRAEISFRPRGENSTNADIMTKVFRQISDNNQLNWARSDMFADGIIKSRGFLDVRLSFNDSSQGEVVITKPNAKNVIIDPDGEAYDPDTWGDLFTTRWMTADDVAVLYNKEDAELLRNRDNSTFPYGYDSIQMNRDRFGDLMNPLYAGGYDMSNVLRNIRVVDRQYRLLDRQKHFLSPETGDTRPVPDTFDRNKIAFFVEKYGFQVITKLVRRIRWFVMADNVELHNDWSPYKHLTIIPYFPYFRDGKAIGLVENLLGPQELLNKTSSQELHIVNTTANSGYKVRAGALTNMTVQELEEKGAQTGLVIEVNGDPDKDVQKIAPNPVPTGLDRISYKAEEHIKTISGVGDSQMGLDRADVAAKAIQAKQKAASTNLVKPLDNLTRSDFFLARAVVDLVQEFYSEERLMTITRDHTTGESESFTVNKADEYGNITNDLTIGEYDIIVTSVPARETLEDSQFEQAMSMREAGIQIPDSVLIDSSRLMNKKEIIETMTGSANTPEAQAQREMQQRAQAAEVAKTEGEAAQKHADAGLRQAKTGETQAKTAELLQGEPDDGGGQAKMAEAATKDKVANHKMSIDEALAQQELSLKEREHALKEKTADDNFQLKAQDLQQKRMDARVQAAATAAAAAQKPAPKATT